MTTTSRKGASRTGTGTAGRGRSALVRKLALAGVGAAALAREEVQRQFDRLVEKGTELDRDGRLDLHLDFGKRAESLKKSVTDLRKNVSQFRGDIENRLDKFVGKVRTSVRTARKDAAKPVARASHAMKSASKPRQPRRRPEPHAPESEPVQPSEG